MALDFPSSPAVGTLYPDPSTPGVTQYVYTGTRWDAVPVFIRTNSQTAYNNYVWPDTLGLRPGDQLTDLLNNGVLSWEIQGGPFVYLDDISSQFNGTQNIFTLTQAGQPYTPDPLTNLIIVLGGIVQTPGMSYTVSGPQITFSLAPAPGAAFTAISNLNC